MWQMKCNRYDPLIHLSTEDWDAFTKGLTLVDEEGELDRQCFEQCILLELQRFSNRRIAHQMNESLRDNTTDSTLYLALKTCLTELYKLSDKISESSPCTSNDEVSQLKEAVAEQQSTIRRQHETLDALCGRVTSVHEHVDEMRGLIQFLAEQHGYRGRNSSPESAHNSVVLLSSPREGGGQSSQNPGDLGHGQRPSIDNSYRDQPHSQSLNTDYTKRPSLGSHRSSNSAGASGQKSSNIISKARSSSVTQTCRCTTGCSCNKAPTLQSRNPPGQG